MKNQHGFMISEFVLSCVIASLVLAITVPTLLRWVGEQQQHSHINSAINDTFTGMEFALTTHWQQTNCRTSPSLTLPDLIADYGVPLSVTENWPLTVRFDSDSVTPKVNRSLSVIISAPTKEQATSSLSWLQKKDGWILVNGKLVTITRPVTVISSLMEQANFNPTTGCMESL